MISYELASIIIVITNFMVVLMACYYLGYKLQDINKNIERRNRKEGVDNRKQLFRSTDFNNSQGKTE
tara:strand:+ start:66 stop:266 length:201 start_codon:yes stop_codon:yes gene_type:complete